MQRCQLRTLLCSCRPHRRLRSSCCASSACASSREQQLASASALVQQAAATATATAAAGRGLQRQQLWLQPVQQPGQPSISSSLGPPGQLCICSQASREGAMAPAVAHCCAGHRGCSQHCQSPSHQQQREACAA
jgi:hypothetical protein